MTQPPGWPASLPFVYGIRVLPIELLYPMCRWFAEVEAAARVRGWAPSGAPAVRGVQLPLKTASTPRPTFSQAGDSITNTRVNAMSSAASPMR